MALASAILFGASTPFSKLLLGEVNPQLLAGLLYLGAGGGLAIVHLGRAAIGLPGQEQHGKSDGGPTAKDAKYGFGGLIDLAHAEPVAGLKHGRSVVVVMPVEESSG
jgi:hypothetical protein